MARVGWQMGGESEGEARVTHLAVHQPIQGPAEERKEGPEQAGQAEPQKLVWTQESVTGPLERAGAVLVYDSRREKSVLFGGVNTHKRLDDTWEWDGRFWTQKTKDNQIPEIWSASAVYDSQRGRVVLFGGAMRGGKFNHATYEYDGENWMRVAEDGPRARNYQWQMAYDERRGRTVLYGGCAVEEIDNKIVHGPYLDDTWEWDGKKWEQVAKGGPPPSCSHGIVYDAARGVTVVLVQGNPTGEKGERPAFGETWTWDGVVWKQVSAVGPRQGDVMKIRLVFDSDRKVVVGILPKSEGSRLDVVHWEWDGTEWKEHQPDPMPHIFNGIAVAYDKARQRMVLFCGENSLEEGNLGEMWEYGVEYVGP